MDSRRVSASSAGGGGGGGTTGPLPPPPPPPAARPPPLVPPSTTMPWRCDGCPKWLPASACACGCVAWPPSTARAAACMVLLFALLRRLSRLLELPLGLLPSASPSRMPLLRGSNIVMLGERTSTGAAPLPPCEAGALTVLTAAWGDPHRCACTIVRSLRAAIEGPLPAPVVLAGASPLPRRSPPPSVPLMSNRRELSVKLSEPARRRRSGLALCLRPLSCPCTESLWWWWWLCLPGSKCSSPSSSIKLPWL